MPFFDLQASGPAAKFNTIGDTITGVITEPYFEKQDKEFGTDTPKVDSNGKAVMMAIITVMSDVRDPSIPGHDGTYSIYCNKPAMKNAIGRALQEVDAADLEVGGKLTITYTGDQPSGRGFPQKLFKAEYVPPAAKASVWGGESAPAAPAAPAATAAPAPVDLVAVARAAQEKLNADRTAMAAKSAPVNGNNGHTDPAADLLKIRELGKLGLEPAAISAAMPGFSMDMIVAALAV